MPLTTPAAQIGIHSHLHRPDRQPERAERDHVDHQHDRHPQHRAAIDIALEPVVGRAVAIALQRVLVHGLGAVQLRTFPHHLADAARLRAMRVFLGFALGVVLAVDRRPLPGHHAGGQPQPEAEKVAGNRVQIERPMGLVTVQEDRHRGDRDVGENEGHDDVAPPWEIEQPVVHADQHP